MTKIVPLANVTQAFEPIDSAALIDGVITIGNFDGVHRGHVALLREVRSVANRVGGPAIAVALDPHPAAVLRPGLAPVKLTTIARRAELMQPLEIDALIVCDTRGGLLKLTADQFFEALIRKTLAAKVIVEGPNFFFGRDRGGDIDTLRRLADQSGIEVQIVNPESQKNEMVSSTRIRHLISAGEMEAASDLLGYDYQIRGQVVSGAQRGRSFGFPTANLDAIDTLVPSAGVYGGWARTSNDLTNVIPAAIHIGPNPTFDNDPSTKVEVHLIDYDGELYERDLFVDFAFRLRDIIKFDSAAKLIEQLRRDVEFVRDQLLRR